MTADKGCGNRLRFIRFSADNIFMRVIGEVKVKAGARILFKIISAAALFNSVLLYSEVFRFKFTEGESYKIHSEVNEDVYVNNVFSHRAQIVNRIVVKVSEVKTDEQTGLDSALFSCVFMTSEQNSNKSFSWGREYPSVFRRDALGRYEIGGEYFMPVVRDVPVFPDRDLTAGSTWTADGKEAHDFREIFGIEKPFEVPFTVNYTYEGDIEKDGKVYCVINAEYNLNYRAPDFLLEQYSKQGKTAVFPVRTGGKSSQKLYWDRERGNLAFYTETFKIRLILNTSQVLDYTGSAGARVIYIEPEKKESAEESIKRDIEKLGLKNTGVKKTKEGITISIENIRFEPDSSVLHESEKEKLRIIGEVLKKFPDTELLVTGHTALAGTLKDRQALSEKRAQVVADYLLELGVRTSPHIFTRGLGSRVPLFPNTTEENKARNRRVEITVLE